MLYPLCINVYSDFLHLGFIRFDRLPKPKIALYRIAYKSCTIFIAMCVRKTKNSYNYSASGAQQPFAERNSRSLSGVEANKPASTPLSLR